jgi:hypothetical protein
VIHRNEELTIYNSFQILVVLIFSNSKNLSPPDAPISNSSIPCKMLSN